MVTGSVIVFQLVVLIGFSRSDGSVVGVSGGCHDAGMSSLSSLWWHSLFSFTNLRSCHVFRMDSCFRIFFRYAAFVIVLLAMAVSMVVLSS